MPRPLRPHPVNRRPLVVEVTSRTLQGRYLLKPSTPTNSTILGILGRALSMYPGVRLCEMVFLSNHYHLILIVEDEGILARFMGYLNDLIARKVGGRLHGWREKFWGRRYRSIPILDEEALVERTRYIFRQGAKECLIDCPTAWPGVCSVRALKVAQRWILREIVEHLPVHGAAHGFLAGRSIVTNAREHLGSKLLLQVDLKNFFPTITYRRVRGLFRKAGYREQVATLLALLCTESPREVVELEGTTYYVALGPRCLPQGAPTSPALTNTICLRLDRRLAGLARKLGWRYTRYADDLTFSLSMKHKGKPGLGKLLGGIKAIASDEGFQVNQSKTHVSRPGNRQKVCGLIVNGEAAPRVPRPLRRQLRAALHNLEAGKPLPEGESLSRLAGYAAFVYQSDPELRRRLLGKLGEVGG